MKPVILIVIESPEQRAVFNQCLRGTPYRVVFANDGEDGFDRVREVQPDLVLAHLHTPRIDGTILCQLVRQESHGTMPVILFGEAQAYDGDAQQRAESVGARAFLALEQVAEKLVDALARALIEPAAPSRLKDPSGAHATFRAPSIALAVPEEAPFESGDHENGRPIEDTGDDIPTSLTAAPEEPRRAFQEAAEASPTLEAPPIPRPQRTDDILDEPYLPVSALGPARAVDSGGATGRSHGDALIQELPRDETSSASQPDGLPVAPQGSRQRKGLDESQLGKRLVRRVQQVHLLLEHVDYYQLLGVEPTARQAQLRSAYFELSLEFHPDRFFLLRSGDIKAKIYAIFRHVSEAYAVLSDERRRGVYDEQRELRRAPEPPLGVRAPTRPLELRAPSLIAEARGASIDPRDPRLQMSELRLDGVTSNAGARRYVQLAQMALKQADLDQARLLLGLAVGLDTMNVSLRRVLEGVARRRARQVRTRYGEIVSSAGG